MPARIVHPQVVLQALPAQLRQREPQSLAHSSRSRLQRPLQVLLLPQSLVHLDCVESHALMQLAWSVPHEALAAQFEPASFEASPPSLARASASALASLL